MEAVSTDRVVLPPKRTLTACSEGRERIYDATCPRDHPTTLAQRMEEKRFGICNAGAVSTEARVAILGNWFFRPPSALEGF